MPNSCAIAGRCSKQFVLPEIAACTKIAFSKLSIVTISDGRIFSIVARRTDCLPASRANASKSGLVAGISALPGKAKPSASAMICIVDAVPINEQAPQLGQALHFAQSSFSSPISPRSNFALYIPSCSNVSISGPAFIVPPGTNTAGIFTLAIPIKFPGTPLSQLDRYTPASNGVAFA